MTRLSLIAAAMLSVATPARAQTDGDEQGSASDPAPTRVDAPSIEPLPAANELAIHHVRDVDDYVGGTRRYALGAGAIFAIPSSVLPDSISDLTVSPAPALIETPDRNVVIALGVTGRF
jgi:hypothetical protein